MFVIDFFFPQGASSFKFHGCSHHLQWFWNPRKESLSLFPLFPHLFAMKWWNRIQWYLSFESWVLSQLFHSPLSPSSRGSSVPLCFLPVEWGHLHIWGTVICQIFLLALLIPTCDISNPGLCIIYSTLKLNKQGKNIQPFPTPFPILNESATPYPVLLLLDPHRGFSGYR